MSLLSPRTDRELYWSLALTGIVLWIFLAIVGSMVGATVIAGALLVSSFVGVAVGGWLNSFPSERDRGGG